MPLPLGPFPYILTNGTLADANQVMANFNILLNGVNGLAPLAVPVAGSSSNIAATLGANNASVTVTADTVTVATALNGTAYTLTSYSQSFNGATTGPGGMDTGATPTSSYVALYAIYNPTAPAISILGKNAAVSAPTIYNGANMPAGYTASALLGVWPTTSTPNLQAGVLRGKQFWYGAGVTVLNASTVNQPTFTPLSLVSAVPPNAIMITNGYITIAANASEPTVNANVALTSGVSAQIIVGTFIAASTAAIAQVPYGNIVLSTPQSVSYAANNISVNVTASIVVTGYAIP